jgi:hypothetical protein
MSRLCTVAERRRILPHDVPSLPGLYKPPISPFPSLFFLILTLMRLRSS